MNKAPYVKVTCEYDTLYVHFCVGPESDDYVYEMEFTGSGQEPLPMDVVRSIQKMVERETAASVAQTLFTQRFILDYVLLVPRNRLQSV